jgi:hypothetical protein
MSCGDNYNVTAYGDTTASYYSAGTCWGDWNVTYKVTSSTSTNEVQKVWVYWQAPNGTTGGIQATPSTSAWDTATIWGAWTPVGSYRVATPNPLDYSTIVLGEYQAPVKTPEEIAAAAKAVAQAAAEAIQRREAERVRELERIRLANEATVRAEDLLLSILNRRQRKEWKEKKQISLYEAGFRHPKFILKNLSSHNVHEYDPKTGKRIIEHCVVTRDVPMCDMLATQVLYLKNAPEELLRVANHTPVR